MEWDFSDDNKTEQHNTLVLLDTVLGKHELDRKPTFFICGGAALLLRGVVDVATVDIDVCTKLDSEIHRLVSPLITDNVASIITLPINWRSRTELYREDLFKNCEVRLLSVIDIAVSKLVAWRHKDVEDFRYTRLVSEINVDRFSTIVKTELPDSISDLVLGRLLQLL